MNEIPFVGGPWSFAIIKPVFEGLNKIGLPVNLIEPSEDNKGLLARRIAASSLLIYDPLLGFLPEGERPDKHHQLGLEIVRLALTEKNNLPVVILSTLPEYEIFPQRVYEMLPKNIQGVVRLPVTPSFLKNIVLDILDNN